jgi:hypothetical protein
MRNHFLRLAVAILTFIIGLSIATVVLKPVSKRNEGIWVPAPAAVSPAWPILLSWQDRDLTQIQEPQKSQLKMAIEALRSTRNQFLEPRLFSRVSTFPGEERYVLVEESPLVYIPGDSRLQISIFYLDGTLLDSSEFGAGWRISLSGIRFTRVNGISGDVLEVKSAPHINGADIGKQYYAVIGDKMRLIRLEDSNGGLIANYYSSPNHTIGFTEVGRSAEEWENSLITKDEAQSLATLTWLSGFHLNIDEGAPNYVHEDLSEARLVEEVRARPGVKKIVNALKDANNPWLREAARLAAEQMH